MFQQQVLTESDPDLNLPQNQYLTHLPDSQEPEDMDIFPCIHTHDILFCQFLMHSDNRNVCPKCGNVNEV